MREHMYAQKFVFILGHPLTATRPPWLIELKGQRVVRVRPADISARGLQEGALSV
jgi:hypothetical protein